MSASRSSFWLSAVLLLGCIAASSGCLVLSLNRFVDDSMVSLDDHWVGTWKDVDDGVTVTIERSEWQSYRLSYESAIATGQLTGYLFQSGAYSYLDVMPVRGQDPGMFTLAVHALVRVKLDGQAITVWPMSYDWFRKAVDAHTAPKSLALVRDERDQVVATADAVALREWLSARTDEDPAFGAAAIFIRQ